MHFIVSVLNFRETIYGSRSFSRPYRKITLYKGEFDDFREMLISNFFVVLAAMYHVQKVSNGLFFKALLKLFCSSHVVINTKKKSHGLSYFRTCARTHVLQKYCRESLYETCTLLIRNTWLHNYHF